jgi:hypothetical protein
MWTNFQLYLKLVRKILFGKRQQGKNITIIKKQGTISPYRQFWGDVADTS